MSHRPWECGDWCTAVRGENRAVTGKIPESGVVRENCEKETQSNTV